MWIIFVYGTHREGFASGKCLLEKGKGTTVNIYVGNMSYEVREDDLREAFGRFGEVKSVNIITDRYNGMSKGFGFVEMPSEEEAKAAIEGLNGKSLKGRDLSVNEARPRQHNRDRGGRPGGGAGRRW